MDAVAERQVRVGVTGDIEAIGVRKPRRIAIAPRDQHLNEAATDPDLFAPAVPQDTQGWFPLDVPAARKAGGERESERFRTPQSVLEERSKSKTQRFRVCGDVWGNLRISWWHLPSFAGYCARRDGAGQGPRDLANSDVAARCRILSSSV